MLYCKCIDTVKINHAIRAARGTRGQKWLAGKLGVTISAISQWETGAKTPTLANLRKLSRVTKTPLAQLFGGRA